LPCDDGRHTDKPYRGKNNENRDNIFESWLIIKFSQKAASRPCYPNLDVSAPLKMSVFLNSMESDVTPQDILSSFED